MIELDKYLTWVKVYSQEESALKLVHSIETPNFPSISFGFPSGDGLFPGGYILFLEGPPSEAQDDVMSELASHGSFVMATDNWETAQDLTMKYIKHEAPVDDERFLPDEISVN